VCHASKFDGPGNVFVKSLAKWNKIVHCMQI